MGGSVRGGLALSGGRLIVTRMSPGGVLALDATSGRILWDHPLDSMVGSPPVLCQGQVVVVTLEGIVMALDPSSGRERWRRPLGPLLPIEEKSYLMDRPWILSSPLCHGNMVCVGSATQLACMEPSRGELLWHHEEKGQNWPQLPSPSLWSEDIVHIFGRTPAGMIAFTPGGTMDWGLLPQGTLVDPAPSPVGAEMGGILPSGGGDLLIGTSRGKALRFYSGGQEKLWQYSLIATPAQAPDRVILPLRSGQVVARTLPSARFIWSHTVKALPLLENTPGYDLPPGRLMAQPVVAGEVVYLATLAGTLVALDLEKGHELWRFQDMGPVGASMALGEDLLFLATMGGHVLAFQEESPR